MDFNTILNFWFKELTPEQWWKKDAKLDETIKNQFLKIHQQAAAGELFSWRHTACGCLAEVIILDQFSRHLYRKSPLSFAFDGMALVLAQEAIRRKFNQQMTVSHRTFLYMPFMHSESPAIQDISLELFSEPGLEEQRSYAQQHAEIIKRFGRFPHRNTILNLDSTKEEIAFLQHHSGF
ncbi:DUF924 family protein [Legionella jamestowniensis]|uniref:Transmembrane protein n=1 Tax=Legionella jamestowniensis TaxID=455 RepID=A0A0W0UU85_9GAMM|nr:DUF924 family protein [Legionella jamestowniensis]KTD11427.1 hypothetical protein Ljam_0621 [Legionella jamestowniensis]SFL67442.1 Uncharacterized conserved protein, DUF924 family [Legionella jamestowniensis DSM 19215]